MRIIRLNLIAFGPFENSVLDFSSGFGGLHVVYGANEAGKSSALRGLVQMLFGIPLRSPDDFIHPYGKMRIGGVIRLHDDTDLEFVRRKGKKNTLRDALDKEPIDESPLQQCLGDLDADLFTTMFGLGHQDLVRGGKEIIQGSGDVGQALFAAGSGISDLRGIQTALQAEAEALFSPTASKKPINDAIATLRANRKAIREAQLPGSEWQRHDQALRIAEKRRQETDAAVKQKQAEYHRLERIEEALPLIGKRQDLIKDLGSLSEAARLPDDFGDRRRALLTDLRIAQENRNQALKTVEEIEGALEDLDISQDVLGSAELVEQVYRELGGYQKAAGDRTQLEVRASVLRGEAKGILSGLRQDLTLEEADRLRLKKNQMVRIKTLGAQYERLIARLDGAREEVRRLRKYVTETERTLKDQGEPVHVYELRDAVERAQKFGLLEDHYLAEKEELDKTEKNLEIKLNRQPFWAGSLKALSETPLPATETIDALDEQFVENRKKREGLESEINALEHALDAIAGRIQEFRLDKEVPTEEDLAEARNRREKGWQLLRKVLQGTETTPDETEAFIKLSPPAKDLVEAYEHTVRQADLLADRLRREADRVAEKAKLIADRETETKRLRRLQEQLKKATMDHQESEEAWETLWRPMGISPGSPREMRAWVRDQQALLEEYGAALDRMKKTEDLGLRISEHRKLVERCLKSLSLKGIETESGLADLIKEGRTLIQEQEEMEREHEKLAMEKRQRRQELKEAESRIQQIEDQLSQWQRHWERAVQPLGLSADAFPPEADAVMGDLKNLFDRIREIETLTKRIQGIDRDEKEYAKKVTKLAERLAPALGTFDADRIATELNLKLVRARAAESERQGLERQKDKEAARIRRAEERMITIRSKLDGMCQEAGCSRYDDLVDAERRSTERIKIESEIEHLEEQLHRLSAGRPLEAFVKMAIKVDPDEIEAKRAGLAKQIEALELERTGLDRDIGEARNELARMDGRDTAAELAEQCEHILARLDADSNRYARLRLASAVLAMTVERYRQKHQGPVLEKTKEHFAELTLGSFEGVRAEYSEQGAPMLVGVRGNGKEIVGVEGMSDGTTDQLFLALRLASLEVYLEQNPPMPLILDDILIRFDDERACAALKILDRLSRMTQVIFFTHHKHLLALAESVVDRGRLFQHELSR